MAVKIPTNIFSDTNKAANLEYDIEKNDNSGQDTVDLNNVKSNFVFVRVRKGFFRRLNPLARVPEGYILIQQSFFGSKLESNKASKADNNANTVDNNANTADNDANTVDNNANTGGNKANTGFSKPKSGLSLKIPFLKEFLIPIGDMDYFIHLQNSVYDKDHWPLNFHPIGLSVRVDPELAHLIIKQPNGIKQVRIIMSNVITTIVNNSSRNDLRSLEIDFSDTSSLDSTLSLFIESDDVRRQIANNIEYIRSKYGLVVNRLTFGEYDYDKEIEEMLSKEKTSEKQRKINEEDALSQQKVKNIEAETKKNEVIKAAEAERDAAIIIAEGTKAATIAQLKAYKDTLLSDATSEQKVDFAKTHVVANGSAKVTFVQGNPFVASINNGKVEDTKSDSKKNDTLNATPDATAKTGETSQFTSNQYFYYSNNVPSDGIIDVSFTETPDEYSDGDSSKSR